MVMIIAMLVMTAMVKMMTDDFHGDVDHGLDGHAVMLMVMLRMMIVMMILMRMTLVMTMTSQDSATYDAYPRSSMQHSIFMCIHRLRHIAFLQLAI